MKKNKKQVRNLVFTSLMAALSVVLGLYITLPFSQVLEISIDTLPIHAVGFLLGPFWGGLAGLVNDVFAMIRYGSFISFFTVAAIMSGVIPGIAYVIFKDKLHKNVILIAVVLLVTLLVNTFFNTLALHYSFGSPYEVLLSKPVLLPKLIAILVKVVLYTLIFRAVLPASGRMLRE